MSGNDFRGEQEPAELARLLPVPAAGTCQQAACGSSRST